MELTFYQNNSDKIQVVKNLTTIKTVSAQFYEQSSVLTPVVIMNYDSTLCTVNYFYLPYYGRYYFITDITVMDGNRMRITGKIDVLMSYATQIKSLQCIVDKQQPAFENKYINDGSYVVTDKEFNTVINFPSGLLDNGEFILITAGG